MFCEPYLATGRHIEVQVLADTHGTVWAIGERECSIQRRHQKVVEEAPSPLVERIDGMRAQLFESAAAAAKTIGYTGAGTVEFLADEDGRFFFLEMNTRLQVEHPVTECTTGLDLVALQIAIADGAATRRESPYRHKGIRSRSGCTPRIRRTAGSRRAARCTGSRSPASRTRFAVGTAPSGLRLDSGVRDGAVVSVHYDPMLAKVISWAPTRRRRPAARATRSPGQQSTASPRTATCS